MSPPYSNNNTVGSTVSTVSNYCLTILVFNWQVYQLLSKLLLNCCSVEMKLLSNYCTVWWLLVDKYCTCKCEKFSQFGNNNFHEILVHNNFEQMLTFKHLLFGHFAQEANEMCHLGGGLTGLPGYYISLASCAKWLVASVWK